LSFHLVLLGVALCSYQLLIIPLLILCQCNMQEGLEGNPIAGTMKKVSRVFAVASVPLTMGFPNVILPSLFYCMISCILHLLSELAVYPHAMGNMDVR